MNSNLQANSNMDNLQFSFYNKGIHSIGDHYTRRKLSDEEIRKLRTQYPKALYIRNMYDFDCTEKTNYWCVILDKFYEIDELPSKSTRKNLRKSLSVYTYRLATKDEMIEYGYQIQCECDERFGIPPRYTNDEFRAFVERAFERHQEFWIGYHTESMEPAMWELISIRSDYVIENSERLSYKFIQHNPTYGLNWTIAKYYLKEKVYKYIEAGEKSLSEHSNVQDFLIDKFCFRKAYCHLQVWVHPLLRTALFLAQPFKKLLSRKSKLKALFALYDFSKSTD